MADETGLIVEMSTTTAVKIDKSRVRALMAKEQARFARLHPASAEMFAKAKAVMPDGVPMSWCVENVCFWSVSLFSNN